MNRYNTHNTHKHTRRTHINTHVTHTQHSTHTHTHTHTHTNKHTQFVLLHRVHITHLLECCEHIRCTVHYKQVIQHFMSVLKLFPFPPLKCNEHLHDFAQDYQILVLYQYHFNASIKQPLIGNSTLNAFVAYIYQTSISLSQAVSTLRASVSHSPLSY